MNTFHFLSFPSKPFTNYLPYRQLLRPSVKK